MSGEVRLLVNKKPIRREEFASPAKPIAINLHSLRTPS